MQNNFELCFTALNFCAMLSTNPGKEQQTMSKRSFANEYFYAYAGFAFYYGKAYTCIAAKPG
jgi:hypothetical protein